ncbi:MAG: 1,4-dihydroxy-6-naphthoate synthase [Desulfobulbus sp.]|nr:1,4-dihydroxy-6-naphthoate synthase [Desulfobulbus sp.]
MSDTVSLRLGYSPCPNDTYIFNALVHGRIPLSQCKIAAVQLEDVETLNEWALEKRLDITKLSFHAFAHVQEHYTLLRSGAALGRGCGPLLITGSRSKPARLADWKIAVPGKYTTAALLLRLFQPACRHLVVMRFDQIMTALAAGEVDAGVIIHESRFTYQDLGFVCLQDLGEWWEQTTGLPIPLGCIAAKKSIPAAVKEEFDRAIAASIHWADTHYEEGWGYIRTHAQEMDIQVMRSHIALYVNEFSKDIGREGALAIGELFKRGAEIGLFPVHADNGPAESV